MTIEPSHALRAAASAAPVAPAFVLGSLLGAQLVRWLPSAWLALVDALPMALIATSVSGLSTVSASQSSAASSPSRRALLLRRGGEVKLTAGAGLRLRRLDVVRAPGQSTTSEAATSARMTVRAMGWNILPSTPVRARMGM